MKNLNLRRYLRNGLVLLAAVLSMLPFQNCANTVSEFSPEGSGNSKVVDLAGQRLFEIQLLTDSDANSYDYSIKESGIVVDSSGQALSKYADLAPAIQNLFNDIQICALNTNLPPDTMVCMAFTMPIARALTIQDDMLQEYNLTQDVICQQAHYDLCGDKSGQLRSLIQEIRSR